MRIAIITDDYLPDSTLVHAKMLHELAVELIAQKHDPIVICPGSIDQKVSLQADNIDGVEIWRFRSGQTRGVGKVKRAINETLLSFNAWRSISTKVREAPFDGVIYYSPSIFFGPLVKKIKKLNNCKSYLVLRDSFPQWAVDEGLIRPNSLIEKYFRYFEAINYDAANAIGLMSPRNLDIFDVTHSQRYNSHVLYNWADDNPSIDDNDYVDVRHELDLYGKTILFYGGNIGHAQDIPNLLRLAESMKSDEKVHFLFVGQGDQVALVKSKIGDGSSNISFVPSVNQNRFRHILSQVDVGLFSLAYSHKVHNFPGKILGYMVESLPILGSVNPNNDLLDVINDSNSGCVYTNGEDEELLFAANKLANDIEYRKLLGMNARQLLNDSFSVKSAANTIISSLFKSN